MSSTNEETPATLPPKDTTVEEPEDRSTAEGKRQRPGWLYFAAPIIILIIIAVLGHFGYIQTFHWYYYVIALVAILIWHHIFSKMRLKSMKAALVVNIETGELWPLLISGGMWKKCKKIGKPQQSFETPDGTTVELLRRFDPEKMELEYPYDKDHSDIALAMVPKRYGELIDLLKELTLENHRLKNEKDLDITRGGIKKGQEYAKMLDDIMQDTFIPEDPKK